MARSAVLRGRDVQADWQARSEPVNRAAEVLSGLPAVPERSPRQRFTAGEAIERARAARGAFAAEAGDQVYDLLTEGRTRRHRLTELLQEAAVAFPGLVPDQATLREERTRPQADKEGHEIDQGILARSWLNSPVAGPHLVETMLYPTARAVELLPVVCLSGEADFGSVHFSRRDGVAYLTMFRPDSLNAEDERQVRDLETAVDVALLDPAVQAIVLRGGVMSHPRYAGRRVFSAGINLRMLRAGQISLAGFLLERELGYLNKIRQGLRVDGPRAWRSPAIHKPWVAAVDAFAIGGGTQLLLVMDHVVAADDAWLSLPAAQEGIVPGLANLRLARLSGPRVARQLILQGRRLPVAHPDARGLVDEVVAPDEVGGAAERAASRLRGPAVAANRRMLALGGESAEQFRTYMAEFALQQALRLYENDVLERVQRFGE